MGHFLPFASRLSAYGRRKESGRKTHQGPFFGLINMSFPPGHFFDTFHSTSHGRCGYGRTLSGSVWLTKQALSLLQLTPSGTRTTWTKQWRKNRPSGAREILSSASVLYSGRSQGSLVVVGVFFLPVGGKCVGKLVTHFTLQKKSHTTIEMYAISSLSLTLRLLVCCSLTCSVDQERSSGSQLFRIVLPDRLH